MQIDDTLVQAHLEAIFLEPSPQVSAHLLQAADIAQGQRDAVLVKGRGLFDVLSSGDHFARFSWTVIFFRPVADSKNQA